MSINELRLKLSNVIREIAPEKSRVIEVFGFFVLAFGLFLGVSLTHYSPADIDLLNSGQMVVSNLGGPLGARLAHTLIYFIGTVSFIWPLALLLWGGLIAFGFIVQPKAKRFAAFFMLSVVFAVFCTIENITYADTPLPFGYGGVIGTYLGKGILLDNIGYGGALLFLAFAGVATLVLTGNFKFSALGQSFEYLTYTFKRAIHQKQQSVDFANTIEENLVKESDEAMPQKSPSRSRKKQAKTDEQLVVEENIAASNSGLKLDLSSSVPKNQKVDTKIYARANITTSKTEDSQDLIEMLTEQLSQFKINGKVTNVTQGPIVTTYEFEPAPGTKISKIKGLEDDLARLLQTTSLRILAPVPGKNTVGFEIPNNDKKVIRFGNLVDSSAFKSKDVQLPIAMGVDTFGKAVIEDLAEMPHLLVAGATGSGKSVFINTLLSSLLTKHSSKELRLVLFDPKMVELGAYNKAAHLACPVITDPQKDGLNLLKSLVDEMENRYRMLNSLGAKNMKHFNEIIKNHRKTEFPKFNGKWQPMPFVVMVIDEFADLILVLGKEAEEAITRLAQKARASGIHLVIATQRPSVQVMTGLIKANFPTRVAFRVMSGIDSRTILDSQGAEALLGKGDMLYQTTTGTHRIHGAYLDEKEIDKLVKACKVTGGSKTRAV